MKLPRDIGGEELGVLLRRFGYQITRQTGSHIRLSSSRKGTTHHVTIPAHKNITIGTLRAILTEIAFYLEINRQDLANQLFGK